MCLERMFSLYFLLCGTNTKIPFFYFFSIEMLDDDQIEQLMKENSLATAATDILLSHSSTSSSSSTTSSATESGDENDKETENENSESGDKRKAKKGKLPAIKDTTVKAGSKKFNKKSRKKAEDESLKRKLEDIKISYSSSSPSSSATSSPAHLAVSSTTANEK